jgi:glyoxylase-like metal-dependent hydrolase (beta-lactamase superfamily II)
LEQRGIPSLETAKKQNPVFKQTKIVLPHMTFNEGTFSLRAGKKTLVLMPMPGHSADGLAVYVEEDRVLFAGDAFMPLPYFIDGDPDEMISSIKHISKMGLENIIQGHGDIILRGEIEEAVRENLAYINATRKAVRSAARKKNPLEALAEVDVESCGKSRVNLGGMAEDLHKRNLLFLYRHLTSEETEKTQNFDEEVV